MSGEGGPKKTVIRRFTLACSWVLGFFAPIKGIYAYIHSGNLASRGISTQLELGQVLINLAHGIGITCFVYVLYYLGGLVVFGLPAIIVMAFVARDEVLRDKYIEKLSVALMVLSAIGAIPVLLGAALVSLDPSKEKFDFVDWTATVIGSFVLFSVYLYIYLSATGQLDTE